VLPKGENRRPFPEVEAYPVTVPRNLATNALSMSCGSETSTEGDL